jgi:hypothetical protein
MIRQIQSFLWTVLFDRSRQGLFDGPAVCVKSLVQHAFAYTKFLRPCRSGLCPAMKLQNAKATLVIVLRFSRRPSDVTRLVVERIVNAVNRVQVTRRSTNVGEEGREVMQPFAADANPSTAIVGVGVRSRIVAALFHALPRFVFLPVSAMATTLAVCSQACGSRFIRQAPAATGVASTQVSAADDRAASALADAAPIRRSRAFNMNALNNAESPECLPGDIWSSWGHSVICESLL